MDRPQQPELQRSGRTPVDQDSREALGSATSPPAEGTGGRVPPANRPGHHPAREQDKPIWAGGAGRKDTMPNARKAELYREAARLGIRGRSRMNKRELVEAITGHGE